MKLVSAVVSGVEEEIFSALADATGLVERSFLPGRLQDAYLESSPFAWLDSELGERGRRVRFRTSYVHFTEVL